MKKLLAKLAALALSVTAICCAFAGCSSSGAAECIGVWSMHAGAGYYSNKGFQVAWGTAISSSDSVMLFDDGTYIWSSVYDCDYTSDTEGYTNWTAPLSYGVMTLYGTYSMTEDTVLEEYVLTIETLTRAVDSGSSFIPEDSDNMAADEAAPYLSMLLGCLQSDTYSLSMENGSMSGTYLLLALYRISDTYSGMLTE